MKSQNPRQSDSPCPSKELLVDFCLGRLSNADAAPIATHLSVCTICEKYLSAIETHVPEVGSSTPTKLARQQPLSHPAIETKPTTPQASNPLGLTATAPGTPSAKELPPTEEEYIGPYRLIRCLGRGGMGVVYHAYQETIRREVALKMILSGIYSGDQTLARFKTEGKALARLQHPNIVQLYEFGEWKELPYYSMELVEGKTLHDQIKEGTIDPIHAVTLVRELAQALEYMHQQGVIHRDLKPSNILITPEGTPKIADFGLAKLLDRESDAQTVTSAVLGTPSYMAPEQASGLGKQISPQTDVYSLGAVLYAMLAGIPPFLGESREEILYQVNHYDPVPLSNLRSDIPPDLEAICLKCLEKKPSNRYSTAQAFANDLDRWLRNEPTLVRPRGPLARFWRKVVRRPQLVTSLVISLLFLIGIGFAFYYSDSSRLTRLLQQELVQGKKVELISNKGELPWHEWRVFPAGFVSLPDQQAISVQAFDHSLLVLMPKIPIDRFRFHAEIRQDQGPASKVGLFFGLTPIQKGEDKLVCYYSLTLNELDNQQPQGLPNGELLLNLRVYRDGPGNLPGIPSRIRGGKPFAFIPSHQAGGIGPWRKLEIEVTPEKIRTYWEGQLAQELTSPTQEILLRNWLMVQPNLTSLGLQFDPRGGLGLLVDEGAAAFRNVYIEPLSSADNSP